MEITRETDYAIRCVLFLSMDPERVYMVGEIADKQNVPKAFLAKILQKLVKGDIVSSIRGVKGGFQLARASKDISMLDVIEAVHGPISLNICVIDKERCDRSGHCSVHPIWVDLQEEFSGKLKKIDFRKLAEKEASLIEGK